MRKRRGELSRSFVVREPGDKLKGCFYRIPRKICLQCKNADHKSPDNAHTKRNPVILKQTFAGKCPKLRRRRMGLKTRETELSPGGGEIASGARLKEEIKSPDDTMERTDTAAPDVTAESAKKEKRI